MKNFMFCVVINDVPYQPTAYSSNKKAAKAEAALACLRGLGFHNTLTGWNLAKKNFYFLYRNRIRRINDLFNKIFFYLLIFLIIYIYIKLEN